jgi:exodeoxyribonuclease VII large subunit
MDNNNYQSLFARLRALRNKIAKQANVKPFMVLHNKVLEAIAEKKPVTYEELSKIKGMGQKRISKYGSTLLEVVKNKEKILSVGEYIDLLNQILVPQRAVIKGEVGKISGRGRYLFFTLRDKNEEAVLNCFVWKDTLDNFGIDLKEGVEIKVEGYPKIFKRRGNFNFEVERIGLLGEGYLKQAFEALKKKLAAAGFFAPERKKKVEKYLRTIGLITSKFGDAKNDFLTHLGKFGFKIYFYDVRVEGLYAVDDIFSAIRYFNETLPDTQVLALIRGGGSLESLQAFNSEVVAKAIFASRIPIITGVGHENDETIADLVADIHASTPTDAARILSDPWRNAALLLNQYKNSFLDRLYYHYQRTKDKIFFAEKFFGSIFNKYKQKLEVITEVFLQDSTRWLKFLQNKLDQLEQILKLSDPRLRLQQGYSIVFNKANQVIKSALQLKIGEFVNLKFYQGEALSKIEKINGK